MSSRARAGHGGRLWHVACTPARAPPPGWPLDATNRDSAQRDHTSSPVSHHASMCRLTSVSHRTWHQGPTALSAVSRGTASPCATGHPHCASDHGPRRARGGDHAKVRRALGAAAAAGGRSGKWPWTCPRPRPYAPESLTHLRARAIFFFMTRGMHSGSSSSSARRRTSSTARQPSP